MPVVVVKEEYEDTEVEEKDEELRLDEEDEEAETVLTVPQQAVESMH
jgi:hypothetical protein